MANVLFWKIQFIASNPLGEYVAGDVLEFYYDNTSSLTSGNISEGITVYKNSVLITSGADIQLGGFDSYLTEQNLSQFGICNGTTMVTPSRLEWDFPYFIGVQFADFPLCAINPPTCNLTIVGVPLVVNATGPDQLDGSITIFASSN